MKTHIEKTEEKTDNEMLSNLLRENGYKVTQSRISILKIFSKYHKPLSADDVSGYIKGDMVDVATVYRTLKSFEEKGVLKRVDLRNGPIYFELNNHHHHHLVCKKCGEIEDVNVCEIDKLNDRILKHSSKFKVILEHSLEFFGVCKTCNKS